MKKYLFGLSAVLLIGTVSPAMAQAQTTVTIDTTNPSAPPLVQTQTIPLNTMPMSTQIQAPAQIIQTNESPVLLNQTQAPAQFIQTTEPPLLLNQTQAPTQFIQTTESPVLLNQTQLDQSQLLQTTEPTQIIRSVDSPVQVIQAPGAACERTIQAPVQVGQPVMQSGELLQTQPQLQQTTTIIKTEEQPAVVQPEPPVTMPVTETQTTTQEQPMVKTIEKQVTVEQSSSSASSSGRRFASKPVRRVVHKKRCKAKSTAMSRKFMSSRYVERVERPARTVTTETTSEKNINIQNQETTPTMPESAPEGQ